MSSATRASTRRCLRQALARRQKSLLTTKMQMALTESYQQRLESLLAVDEGIEQMIQALEATGELANTVIMFTSDNGYMLGEHRLHAGKTVAYEPSALVPLIITGPGFPANVQRRHPISQIDLAPTIADIAAATPTLTVDGVSLIPLARSPVGWPARHLVIEAGPRSLNGPMFYTGVRGSRYVYLEYHETVEVEFYDLMRDPYQLQNLEADPAYDGYQAQLARLLESMRNCVGADCR
ncbi:MAG: sulfatase-like hydrolase/transferase [Geodermatophilaceae bacterium]|nr:sulfatase-like hydrolase/transferase [Geodermatophilaceae bacterium]